ncbi:hypothetical protein SprV_0200733700 [Sparganum proliferum]
MCAGSSLAPGSLPVDELALPPGIQAMYMVAHSVDVRITVFVLPLGPLSLPRSPGVSPSLGMQRLWHHTTL